MSHMCIAKKRKQFAHTISILSILFIFILFPTPHWAKENGKRPLTLQDMMKFKEIHDPLISEKGDWVVYNTKPDRGNGEVIAKHLVSGKESVIPRGSKPSISKNSLWITATIEPDFAELEQAAKDKKKTKEMMKKGLALLNTETGETLKFEKVKTYAFSDDSQWLFYCLYPEEEKKESGNKEETPAKAKKDADTEKETSDEDAFIKPKTSTLVLRRLSNGQEVKTGKVTNVMLDPASRFLAYAIYDKDNLQTNGIYIRDLQRGNLAEPGRKIHGDPLARYSNLAWSKTKSRLAFIFHMKTEKMDSGEKDKSNNSYSSILMVWDGKRGILQEAVSRKRHLAGWIIPHKNKITWTEDEKRIFFGFKPVKEYLWTHPPKKDDKKAYNIYDMDRLLEKTGVDVWHWNDPLINPNQKKQWKKKKERIYTALYYLTEDRFVLLADKDMRKVDGVENTAFTLGYSRQPYMKEMTWDGRYEDVYTVSLEKGKRKQFLTHFQGTVSLSYNGKYAVYYRDKHWHLYDTATGSVSNLTENIETPFYDEDHDYPEAVPGYGIAGWTANDKSVLIYDKYDIWEFPTAKGSPLCITGHQGRKHKMVFRVKKTDKEQKFFKSGETLLLSAYSDEKKYTGFYHANVGKTGTNELISLSDRTFYFVAKAKKANKVLFTRENYEEFPDLWVSDLNFNQPMKITDVNPQQKDFLWGNAQLIEWKNFDGVPLQGIVILPGNYDKTKRYPVLVYYYRFFTQRLHRFNQIVVNHRPCFPYYAGNGYAVFLPDIRFQVGRPGFSAAKCLVPGVQKLIDMGIADPKAIGLHGHSWSGYQTAFVITQTDIFAAAVAGAPVSNMTSAYNGIRWGSGLARQFQYEKSQSRIGASLYDAPELYIENSPVFFAKRITTPLLIEFGDKDEAVPWYQGIELYLTMRRLNKDCIFLQYNDEPHHLKKYPNKLDYTIKMKQYFDHYLKGEPAADWIKKGIPYRKK